MKKNLMISSFAIGISSLFFSLKAFAMPNNTDSYITKAEAKAIALQHADLEEAEVRFVKGTLDYDDGRALYEIEFLKDRKEYDYEIDATDGTILSYDHDIESRIVSGSPKKSTAKRTRSDKNTSYITENEAQTIALEHAGLTESEVRALRCEFDYDDGRAEYEVDFRQGGLEYGYMIDASTGKILEYDQEYDD